MPKEPYDYDLKTEYAEIFGGKEGYLYDKTTMLEEIKKFVEEQI